MCCWTGWDQAYIVFIILSGRYVIAHLVIKTLQTRNQFGPMLYDRRWLYGFYEWVSWCVCGHTTERSNERKGFKY